MATYFVQVRYYEYYQVTIKVLLPAANLIFSAKDKNFET
jgi:hypothetical protein